MSKLIVSPKNYEHLNDLLKMDIDGVLISIKDVSVNDSYYMDIEEVLETDFNDKEVFISMNKLMHNKDLELVKNILLKVKNSKKDIKILFYDMGVYNIAKYYDMTQQLVIYQDHLNASTDTNNFYDEMGVKYSFITSDITMDELLKIKENSESKLMFLAYGYAPIFYSRRYLVSNYLEFINEKKKDVDYQIISDTDIKYPIEEEKYGTTIYTSKPINLINYIDKLNNIDYLVLKSNKIDEDEFNEMVKKYINHEQIDDDYIGFLNTKTIYRVK